MRILCNEEAEQVLLSQMLLDQEQRDIILEDLKETDFYRAGHKKIFTLIKTLAGLNKDTDVIGLVTEIDSKNLDIDKVYLAITVADKTLSARDNTKVIEEVKKFTQLRKYRDGSNQILHALENNVTDEELNQIYEDIKNDVDEKKTGTETLDQIVNNEMLQIESDIENGITHERYIKTGFFEIDRKIKLYPGQSYLLAARPAMGKTSLSLNFALNMARAGEDVIIFTLETSKIQHTYKIISMTQDVTFDQIMEEDKKQKYNRFSTMGDYSINNNIKDKIRIVDNKFSKESIIAEARRQYRKKPFTIMIIDLINQVKQESKSQNRNAEVEEIFRAFDIAAREFEAVNLTISQLNRSVESGKTPEPMMSHLRDSGSLEQTAKGVMLLYRPEYYGLKTICAYSRDIGSEGVAKLIIAKNNFGSTGAVYLHFDKNSTRFTDLDLYR